MSGAWAPDIFTNVISREGSVEVWIGARDGRPYARPQRLVTAAGSTASIGPNSRLLAFMYTLGGVAEVTIAVDVADRSVATLTQVCGANHSVV